MPSVRIPLSQRELMLIWVDLEPFWRGGWLSLQYGENEKFEDFAMLFAPPIVLNAVDIMPAGEPPISFSYSFISFFRIAFNIRCLEDTSVLKNSRTGYFRELIRYFRDSSGMQSREDMGYGFLSCSGCILWRHVQMTNEVQKIPLNNQLIFQTWNERRLLPHRLPRRKSTAILLQRHGTGIIYLPLLQFITFSWKWLISSFKFLFIAINFDVFIHSLFFFLIQLRSLAFLSIQQPKDKNKDFVEIQ